MLTNTRAIKQLVILSGKGGTGKTSLTASLVHLSSKSNAKCVYVDADVDAANLALVAGVNILEKHRFMSSKVAVIDSKKCNHCNQCYEICRYQAVQKPNKLNDSYQINESLCEGCAACVYSCPQSAIEMITQQDGEWYFSSSSYGPLFHAELFPGAENTGKLVTLIKQHARLYAEDHDSYPLVIIDGPPGIGCPVISSSAGADLVLLVSEPGLSGIHDLSRITKTMAHFKIPMLICINKANLYREGTNDIKEMAMLENIPVIGEIPFDREMPKAMIHAMPITKFSPDSPASKAIQEIWIKVHEHLFYEEDEHG